MASVAFAKRQRRMAVRTTMKLKSLLPGVGDLQCPFLTKHTKAEQEKIQRDPKTNLERIMVKWGADAGEKNPKMARNGAKGPLITERKRAGVKKQFAMRAGIQDADAKANDVKRRMTMTNPEKLQEPFVGDT